MPRNVFSNDEAGFSSGQPYRSGTYSLVLDAFDDDTGFYSLRLEFNSTGGEPLDAGVADRNPLDGPLVDEIPQQEPEVVPSSGGSHDSGGTACGCGNVKGNRTNLADLFIVFLGFGVLWRRRKRNPSDSGKCTPP